MGAEPGGRFLKQPAAKLEPVIVESNNRDHMPWSFCLFVPHVYGCYSSRPSHSW